MRQHSRSPASPLWISSKRSPRYVAIQNRSWSTTCPSSLVDGSIPGPTKRVRASIHRARQTVTERVRRKLQRSFPRRMPQPALVRHPGGRPVHHRAMASGLQHGSTSQLPRLSYAREVRSRSSRLTGLMLKSRNRFRFVPEKGGRSAGGGCPPRSIVSTILHTNPVLCGASAIKCWRPPRNPLAC